MTAPIPDYSKVSLLLPMSGANNGTTFVDRSPRPKAITRYGETRTVTDQSKYYGSSVYFDGSGNDYLSIPDHADLDFVDEPFTVGVWSRTEAFSDTYPCVMSKCTSPTSNHAFSLLVLPDGASLQWTLDGSTRYTVRNYTPISLGQWHFFSVCGTADTLYLGVDGVVNSTAKLGPIYNSSAPLAVGRQSGYSGGDYRGHLQDLIILKGAALWTSNFTPPPRLIGDISVETRDESGILVPRKVFAVPRSYRTTIVTGETDANGVATLSNLPACEHTVVALSDDDTLPDLVLRRVPT